MSITAIVENDTIKLPVHVPDGTSVEIVLPVTQQAAGSLVRAWPVPPPNVPREELEQIEAEIEAAFPTRRS